MDRPYPSLIWAAESRRSLFKDASGTIEAKSTLSWLTQSPDALWRTSCRESRRAFSLHHLHHLSFLCSHCHHYSTTPSIYLAKTLIKGGIIIRELWDSDIVCKSFSPCLGNVSACRALTTRSSLFVNIWCSSHDLLDFLTPDIWLLAKPVYKR